MESKIIQLTVLAALCLAFTSGGYLGNHPCAFGPSYWCSSLVNAKECNAVKHCIQTVWEPKVLPEDNDDICTLCKDMVKQARDTLLSNETQEEIREVFYGSCKLIPVKLVRDECIHLADDFIPELIETLASQMNPQMVCATAGLCNSVTVDKLLFEYKKMHPEKESNSIIVKESNAIIVKEEDAHPEPGDCDDCRAFVKDTIRIVKTHSKTELMDRLNAICGRLGSLSDGCMALMQMNFDGIYNYLTQELKPNDFCELVGMCERMYENRKNAVDFHRTDDAPCDFCTVIVQHWKDVLTANTTELEFKEILEGLCRQTGTFKHECLSLVDQYYLPLYNLLVSDIHPKEVCEAVGLCGLNSVFNEEHPVWVLFNPGPVIVQKPVPFTRLKPAVRKNSNPGLIGTDEAAAVHVTEDRVPMELPRVKLTGTGISVASAGKSGLLGPAMGKSSVKDNNKCVMCEFALNFLQNILEQEDTREDIEHAVENLCSYMPKTISEECEDYVEAYGDQVIEFLDQEIDPAKICSLLHLCPASLEKDEVKDDVSCVMCEYAMTQLEEVLKDKKTEESIRHALETLCSSLPKSIEKECDMFVDAYTEQIIDMLIQDLSPDEICIKLHLCKPKKAPLPPLDSSHQLPVTRLGIPALSYDVAVEPAKHKTKQSSICIICEFAMTQLDQMLFDNATEDEIMRGVEFVCTLLPQTIQEDCIGFVEEYGDAIIKLLVHELAPKKVCSEIGLCKAVDLHLPVAVVDTKLDKCDVCERVFDYINEILKSGGATRPIEDVLEKACTILPQKERDFCQDLIEVYGPYLVDMLAELGDGKSVCQAISVCPNNEGKMLLGGKRCTWGPAYWCKSRLHAKSCKAESHCEEVVWKGKAPAI
ncbi:prosaposin [Oratosquilla oratoria]|uniref:prosaposin n=1 Tax=Oratosquilla oratoria TaxID=337810 RepID=UPI003F771D5A